MCGLRIAAAKNSRKRMRARSPAALTRAGVLVPMQASAVWVLLISSMRDDHDDDKAI